jgi:hypothetical protein
MGSTASSTQMVIDKSLDGNFLVTRLGWTTEIGQGLYKLEFATICTVNGSTDKPIRRQFDFDRLYLKER